MTTQLYIAAVAGMMMFVASCGPTPEIHLSSQAPAIVNGRTVGADNEISKSIVGLVMLLDQGQGICTGTLVSNNVVLTAAHCVEGHPQKMVVVFNTNLRAANSSELRAATGYIQHPLWRKNDPRSHGDLALVKFSGPLPSGYHPVTLASPNFKIAKGENVVLAGYGVTDGLSNQGAGILRQTETQIEGMLTQTEIATDGENHSVCFGDSGGPAFVRENGKLVQLGVASSVSNQACDQTSVHTDVQAFENWIQTTAAQL